jgi:hypothetical protein
MLEDAKGLSNRATAGSHARASAVQTRQTHPSRVLWPAGRPRLSFAHDSNQVCLLICFPMFRIKPNHDSNLCISSSDYVAKMGQTALHPLLLSVKPCSTLSRIANDALLRSNQTTYLLRYQTKPRGSLHTKKIRCRARLLDASTRFSLTAQQPA